MKELLQQKVELEKQLDELIRNTDHSSPKDRSRMIEGSGPLLGRMREIEDVLGRQRAKLGGLIRDVLKEVDALAEAGSQRQIRAPLEAVNDLPCQMFDGEGFDWAQLKERFLGYQQHYQARCDYVQILDEIRSSG